MSKPFEYLLRDDFFTESELKLIWSEIALLSDPAVLRSEHDTGSAVNLQTGEPLKKNRGLFLLDFYTDLMNSPTFRAARKIFDNLTIEFSELCFANESVLMTRTSTMLISYYEDNDEYLKHRDTSAVTVLYWLCREPRGFEGGDLYFPQLDEWIEFKNNRMIMFPSQAFHQVSPVKLLAEPNTGMGRFCFSQFLLF